MIGGFTQTLLASVRQFDSGPQNLGSCVNLDDRPEDCFYNIEDMPRNDGQKVGAGSCLVVLARRSNANANANRERSRCGSEQIH